jgi:hypothetical protein
MPGGCEIITPSGIRGKWDRSMDAIGREVRIIGKRGHDVSA